MIILSLICFFLVVLIIALRPWKSYKGERQVEPGVPPWWYPCWYNFAAYGSATLFGFGLLFLLLS
jgi:hypothetical protein